MNRTWWSLIAGASILAVGLGSYAAGAGQESRHAGPRLPEFAMKALTSPTASRANLFLGRDGAITRVAVQVGKEGMPEWLHGVADEKLGKGEDVSYEAEVYPDGSEVVEVYRMVGGKEMQLSLDHRDRSVKYVGRQTEEKELPDKVQATLRGVEAQGFTVEKCMVKEGPRFSEVHVRGMLKGVPHRVRIGGDGKLLSIQRRIPGDVEVVKE